MPWMNDDCNRAGSAVAVTSGIWRRNSSKATLISRRARLAPRQKCAPPPPNPTCGLGLRRTSNRHEVDNVVVDEQGGGLGAGDGADLLADDVGELAAVGGVADFEHEPVEGGGLLLLLGEAAEEAGVVDGDGGGAGQLFGDVALGFVKRGMRNEGGGMRDRRGGRGG